LLKGLLNLYLL